MGSPTNWFLRVRDVLRFPTYHLHVQYHCLRRHSSIPRVLKYAQTSKRENRIPSYRRGALGSLGPFAFMPQSVHPLYPQGTLRIRWLVEQPPPPPAALRKTEQAELRDIVRHANEITTSYNTRFGEYEPRLKMYDTGIRAIYNEMRFLGVELPCFLSVSTFLNSRGD